MLAPPADGSIWSVLGLALLGFALVTLLTRFGGATDQPVHPESSPAASAD